MQYIHFHCTLMSSLIDSGKCDVANATQVTKSTDITVTCNMTVETVQTRLVYFQLLNGAPQKKDLYVIGWFAILRSLQNKAFSLRHSRLLQLHQHTIAVFRMKEHHRLSMSAYPGLCRQSSDILCFKVLDRSVNVINLQYGE